MKFLFICSGIGSNKKKVKIKRELTKKSLLLQFVRILDSKVLYDGSYVLSRFA